MKRSDKMSKEEVFDFFNKIISGDCDECHIKPFCKRINENGDYSCFEAVKKYLFDEVQKKSVSRWQTIKSDEDWEKMDIEFSRLCDNRKCEKCVYRSHDNCFLGYLLEKLEVEDDDE